MINRLIVLAIITFFFLPDQLIGQTSFNTDFEVANPIPVNVKKTHKERFEIHQKYLEKAKQSQNKEQQVYGLLYLFYDHMRLCEYEKAQIYVLEAENIAIKARNIGWEGAVLLRKAFVYHELKQPQKVIQISEKASKLCMKAGDSLCLGEIYELMARGYLDLKQFNEANYYMAKSSPLIAKYGAERKFGFNLANYAELFIVQKRFREAISPLKRAIIILEKNVQYRQKIQVMNNLAEAYRGLGLLDSAVILYNEAINTNKKHDNPDILVMNYEGMASLYEEKGDFKTALEYYKLYNELNESVKGKEVQVKVADLELKYKTKDNELKLQQKETELNRTQRSLAILFCVLLLISFWIWRWRADSLQARKELAQNQENLTKLTKILLDKNTLLTELETQVNELKAPKIDIATAEIQVNGLNVAEIEAKNSEMEEHSLKAEKIEAITPTEISDVPTLEEVNEDINMSSQFEENLYNQRILTDADWAAFKIYFEKANPHYLARLRNINPNISEAEERLALFVKLNLTRKEAAAILGISTDSVKKTRQRLRKRLELKEEEELDEYIRCV